jgi:hypothetical protein
VIEHLGKVLTTNHLDVICHATSFSTSTNVQSITAIRQITCQE